MGQNFSDANNPFHFEAFPHENVEVEEVQLAPVPRDQHVQKTLKVCAPKVSEDTWKMPHAPRPLPVLFEDLRAAVDLLLTALVSP